MANWIDLGREEKGLEAIGSIDSKKKRIIYPRLCIKTNKLPETKVGETFDASVRLKFVGVSKSNNEEGGWSCDFEVHAIDFGDKTHKREDEGTEIQNAIEEALEERKEEKKKETKRK